MLPKWQTWAEKARALPILRDATYPFPKVAPKLLGIIVQNYRPRGGVPAAGFQKWIDEINETVSSKLVSELRKIGMMLPDKVYGEGSMEAAFCLATIPDFNTLITRSQEHQTPVFALTPQQIGQAGKIEENTLESRDKFQQIFSELADKIIGLTTHASSD